MPVGYFYDGLRSDSPAATAQRADGLETVARAESLDLIRAYYQLDEHPRRRLMALAKSLNEGVEAV